MSPFYSAKKAFSKEEISEILRRNVALYKDEPSFANYIVDLALYLIEAHYEEHMKEDLRQRSSPIQIDTESVGKFYRVFKEYTGPKAEKYCSLCGTRCSNDERVCPHCGSSL